MDEKLFAACRANVNDMRELLCLVRGMEGDEEELDRAVMLLEGRIAATEATMQAALDARRAKECE